MLAVTADDLASRALSAPRYTSYPPATELDGGIGRADAAQALARLGATRARLSLYLHVPFCRSLCWYCGCNVIATRQRGRGVTYVDDLIDEAHLVAGALGGAAPVTEIALGGGSPNFLAAAELTRLTAAMREVFSVAGDARLSIELDPRDTTIDQIDALARAGFSAMSVGVQDFAPAVQDAIHRIQSVESTRALIEAARARGFDDVNVDLVYGLPLQTPESLVATLDQIIQLAPDRIALFGYAHLPALRPHQLLVVRDSALPDARARGLLLLRAIERLTDAGYLHLGLDHFARPGSRLAKAAASGRLDRSFQGYVERRADAVVGLGVTAITTTDRELWQNDAGLESWTASIRRGELPVARGVRLTDDDQVRRAVITRLMCDGAVDLARIGERFGVSAEAYFARELTCLREATDLCTVDVTRIDTTGLGRLLVRNVAMVFDRYHGRRRPGSFSTTV